MVKKFIHIEYGIAFVSFLFLYLHLNFSFLLFVILLFVPDITMIGYLFDTKIGAAVYNVGHSFILPIICGGLSVMMANHVGLMVTLIWLAHIAMDRCLGYGLKYPSAFKETHMQKF